MKSNEKTEIFLDFSFVVFRECERVNNSLIDVSYGDFIEIL